MAAISVLVSVITPQRFLSFKLLFLVISVSIFFPFFLFFLYFCHVLFVSPSRRDGSVLKESVKRLPLESKVCPTKILVKLNFDSVFFVISTTLRL